MKKAVRRIKVVGLTCAVAPVLLIFVSVVNAGGKESAPPSAIPNWGLDIVPPAGDCRRIGWTYRDNPFNGWPIELHTCQLVVVPWGYCDERHPSQLPHWGIDVAYPGIEGANVISTTNYAVVEHTHDGGQWNWGMGNYVQLQALDCWKQRQRIRCLNGECESIFEPLVELDSPLSNWHLEHVEICRETGWLATYMHLQAVVVEVGQRVGRGDVIGRVGATGNATGSHLHYEITSPADQPGGAIDPMPTMCDVWIEY